MSSLHLIGSTCPSTDLNPLVRFNSRKSLSMLYMPPIEPMLELREKSVIKFSPNSWIFLCSVAQAEVEWVEGNGTYWLTIILKRFDGTTRKHFPFAKACRSWKSNRWLLSNSFILVHMNRIGVDAFERGKGPRKIAGKTGSQMSIITALFGGKGRPISWAKIGRATNVCQWAFACHHESLAPFIISPHGRD